MTTKRRFDVIGKPRRRVDGRAKVTGLTRFADDVMLPRMLHCKLLRSPHPHATIESIDVSRAQACPGVHLVLTGKDFPVTFGILPVTQDEYALAPERVRYVGDPVAAVIARDEQTAFGALDLIDVKYRPLKTISDPEEALATPEPRIQSYGEQGNIHRLQAFEFGDVNEALARSDHVFEDVFFYQGNTHLPIEQHASVAAVDGEGKLTLWSSTQVPHYIHRALANALQIPPAHVRVIACPNGGGFGGKCDLHNHEIVVSKAAIVLGRPVKICLTREEVFYMHRGRHPVLMKMRTGVTKDGKITGMHTQTLLDGGAYGGYGAASTFYTGVLQTRARHTATALRPGSAARQDRGETQARSGRAAPGYRRQARYAHRELAEDRHDRPCRVHPQGGRELRLEEQIQEAPRGPRRRACVRRVPVRRGAADLLEQDAAIGRAAPHRQERAGHGVLRRDRDRAGVGRCARGDRRRSARHRRLRRALRHGRHRLDARRSGLVFQPSHGDDGERRDPGCRAPA